jgi:hypothetical protein
MNLEAIVEIIDAEIERLQRVRSLLTGNKDGLPQAAPTRKRRKMSAEGRAKIAAAQKARWAKAKR